MVEQPLTAKAARTLDNFNAARKMIMFGALAGGCRYGELPGTMQEDDSGSLAWQVFDAECQIRPLLPAYINGHKHSSAPASSEGDFPAHRLARTQSSRTFLWSRYP